MAAQLEQDIMMEIGLGPHYNWSNGSGSCEYLRSDAARKLPEVLRQHNRDGKEIALPNNELCSLLERVARNEENRYVLTKTWQAASYVIQAHVYLHHAENEQGRQKIVRNFVSEITKSYL